MCTRETEKKGGKHRRGEKRVGGKDTRESSPPTINSKNKSHEKGRGEGKQTLLWAALFAAALLQPFALGGTSSPAEGKWINCGRRKRKSLKQVGTFADK